MRRLKSDCPTIDSHTLRQAITHDDEGVRAGVVRMLAGCQQNEEAIAILHQMVKQERSVAVRIELVWALLALNQIKQVENLLRTDTSPEVRLQAAVALGRVLATNERVLIEALCSDNDSRVRAAAAQSLGLIKAKKALPELLEALCNSEESIRAEAARALGCIADPMAVPALLAAANEDPNSEVRKAALWALVEIAYATKDRTLLERMRAIDPVETARLENRRKRQIQVTREV